jgi:hypothetical protein
VRFKKSKNVLSFLLTGSVVLNLLRVGNQKFLNENIYLFAHISGPLAAPSILLPGAVVHLTPSTIPVSRVYRKSASLRKEMKKMMRI